MNIQKKALGLAGFAAAAAVGVSLSTATTAQAELIGPKQLKGRKELVNTYRIRWRNMSPISAPRQRPAHAE